MYTLIFLFFLFFGQSDCLSKCPHPSICKQNNFGHQKVFFFLNRFFIYIIQKKKIIWKENFYFIWILKQAFYAFKNNFENTN